MDPARMLTQLLLLFSACLIYVGALGRAGGQRAQDAARVSGETGDLSDLHGDLAFRLYRGLAADRPDENILFSPLAVSSALAFLIGGASSQTRAEILSALGISNSTEDRVGRALAALSNLTASLSEAKGEPHLATGSSLHIEKTFRLSEMLQSHSRDDHDRAVRLVDFSKPQQAQQDINAFIKKETRGKITDFLQNLSNSTKSILANYMYFKGRWEQPFEQGHTVNWRFQVNGTLVVEVPMMFRDDSKELRMLYDTNCSSTVVRIPYAGPLAALLLLPRGDLDQLQPRPCLSTARMKFWRTNLRPGRAEIRLPKFVLRKSYPLRSVLEQAGVRTVFTGSADLPGFTPRRELRLQALHETVLEVDETETDKQGGRDTGLDFSEPQRIIFDRPFMLLVYHEPSGTILLIGKIMNPSKN